MHRFKFLRRRRSVTNPDTSSGSSDLIASAQSIETPSKTPVVQPSTSTTPTNALQNDSELRSTTDSLLGYSRFRVLVVGKAGVGKSSLINAIFGVPGLTNVSSAAANQHDIDIEYTSKDNDRLILHDSQGFVGGDIRNLAAVQNFIKRRSAEKELKNRLHAIWLCCETPISGSRVFERGDEILLRDVANNVPIIVVFTKYDQLVMQKKKDLARTLNGMGEFDWDRRVKEAAMMAVKDKCEEPLHGVAAGNRHAWTELSTKNGYKDTIEKLIGLTMESIRVKTVGPHTQTPMGEGAADLAPPNLGGWLFATAQRYSIGTKISTSIDVGRHQYWSSMFSGALAGKPLSEYLRVIHDDIVNIWNFRDSNQCLKSTEFRALMTHMVKDLGNRPNPPSSGDTGSLSPIDILLAGPLFIPATVASWVQRLYQKTSETLRYLMGYVVDIIVVMSCLSSLIDSGGLDQMSPAMINLVLKEYFRSSHKDMTHGQIRTYVTDATLPGLKPSSAIDRISDFVKVDQYKELREAVTGIAASQTLNDQETWITPELMI